MRLPPHQVSEKPTVVKNSLSISEIIRGRDPNEATLEAEAAQDTHVMGGMSTLLRVRS